MYGSLERRVNGIRGDTLALTAGAGGVRRTVTAYAVASPAAVLLAILAQEGIAAFADARPVLLKTGKHRHVPLAQYVAAKLARVR